MARRSRAFTATFPAAGRAAPRRSPWACVLAREAVLLRARPSTARAPVQPRDHPPVRCSGPQRHDRRTQPARGCSCSQNRRAGPLEGSPCSARRRRPAPRLAKRDLAESARHVTLRRLHGERSRSVSRQATAYACPRHPQLISITRKRPSSHRITSRRRARPTVAAPRRVTGSARRRLRLFAREHAASTRGPAVRRRRTPGARSRWTIPPWSSDHSGSVRMRGTGSNRAVSPPPKVTPRAPSRRIASSRRASGSPIAPSSSA